VTDNQLDLYERYQRKDIARALGVSFSRSRWEQGVVEVPPRILLLVTLQKEGIEERYWYHDEFLTPSYFRWQSQKREARETGRGSRYRDYSGTNRPAHLFVRSTKFEGDKARPFVYLGPSVFMEDSGDHPITIVWRLLNAVPRRLWTELGIASVEATSPENAAGPSLEPDRDNSRILDGLEESVIRGDASVEEAFRAVRLRPESRRFRRLVLANFRRRCCICGIAQEALLDAAHIRAHAEVPEGRASPANGLALCVLHHRAFDRGFLRIEADRTIIIPEWVRALKEPSLKTALSAFHTRKATSPLIPISWTA
jgi:hypothetical protein